MTALGTQLWGDLATSIAVKGAAILLIAFLATRLLRRQPAAVRHSVWLAALLAQLATPLLGAVLPAWRPALPAWTLTVGLHRTEPGRTVAPRADITLPIGASSADQWTPDAAAPVVAPAVMGPSIGGPTVEGPAVAGPTTTGRLTAGRLALGVWVIGAGLVLLWLVAGSFGVALVARRAERVTDGEWLTLATRLSAAMGLRRPVVLLRGHGLSVPVTWGVLVPVVLLPLEAEEWSYERRRTVLLHELAHVRRLDMLSQLVAHLVLALCWFDPLVWIGVRALRSEAEHACDDCVLQHGTEPSAYVTDLLAIVRAARPTRVPALAAFGMARPSEFEGRVLAILDASTQRRAVGRLAKLGTVVATLGIVAPLAAMRPAEARPASDAAHVEHASTASSRPVVSDTVLSPTTVGEIVDAAASAASAAATVSAETQRVSDAVINTTVGTTVGSAVHSFTSAVLSAMTNMSLPVQPPVVAPMPHPMPTPAPAVFGGGYRYGLRNSDMPRPARAPRVHVQPGRGAGSSAAVQPLIGALADSDVQVRRAAVHALGELEDPRAVEALMQALRRDADANVRETAAWALGQLEDAKAVPALTEALRGDQSPSVRKQAAWALGQIEDKSSVDALGAALRDQSVDVRRTAVWALGQIEDPRAVPMLVPGLSNSDAEVRKQSAWALGQIESKDAVEPLAAALKDGEVGVRETAAWALGQIEDAKSVPALGAALKDQSPTVRRKAAWALGQIESKDAVSPLVTALSDEDRETRKTAVWALGQIEDPAAATGLATLTRSTDPEMRKVAVQALARIGGENVVEALVALLKDPDPEVRRAAVQALGRH